MFKYLTKYTKTYLIGTLFLIATNLLGAYIPELIKKGINFIPQLISNPLVEIDIRNLVLEILALALIMTIVRVISRQVIFGIGREIEFDLKKEIFEHLITLEPNFFTQKRTGDLISVITNDVQSLRSLGGFAMLNIINTIIAFAVILPLMFNIDTKLTWAFLSLIPLIIIFVILLSGKIKYLQEQVQIRLGGISNFIEQNLSGIHIIKSFGQEDAEIKRFHDLNAKLKDENIELAKIRSLMGPIMRVVTSLGFVLLLYIGGTASLNNSFSPGDFAAYTLYIQRLLWPIATLGWLITVVYRAQVSAKRIGEILQVEAKIKDKPGAIEIKDYSEIRIKLKSEILVIHKGDKLAILGSIGSGKSTLAHKLMHLKEVDDGEILIDGVDIKNIKLESLRTLINLVPQENFLFSTSIAENIAYAKELSETEIEELAKLTCLHDEIMKLPHGYESVVGERGITLSGGQRQRIAIARALAINPEILILDDALSHLDDKSSSQIFNNILKLREKKTTIVITHKTSLVKDFERTVIFER